ncbi:MAG: uracil-DNA glycosylase [Planctomycetota bacterium]|nr:uracil-DNA glycosylase [Planctomycetota bacterium]
MEKDTDITKVVRQHLQMENFFTGGFMVRSNKTSSESHNIEHTDNKQVKAELEKIAEEVRKCAKCGLGSLRTNAVPGEGSQNARIVFVGEGPGADEDAQGRPFVGRSGQLLDKIIANGMGLKRSDVFICNIIKCRPPDNRDPRLDEIISCMPYLQRQIELINPEIIVALGAHAAKSLLNNNLPIGQLRGQFHEYCTGIDRTTIKLMPTYHPAYLLRNYSDDNRKRVWDDMKKVLAELGLAVPKNQRKPAG